MHFTIVGLLVLFCVLLACGGLLWVCLVALMAWTILTPPRMGAGKAIYHLRRLSPGDLGLNFEEQPFVVRDLHSGRKLHIAGWWIPGSPGSNRCVVLIHGYADAKVGAIAFAPLFNDLDFNILAIDLRAHGESDGRFSTGGVLERDDICQVIDQMRARQPVQTEHLVLFGISLGASVATGIAAVRNDVSAVILESPFPTYPRVIAQHALAMNLPGGLMLRTAIAGAQKLSGADFDQVKVIDLVPSLKCPALMIVGSDDPLLNEADIVDLRTANRRLVDSEFWLVEGAGHLGAMALDPIEYRKRIELFLNRRQ